MNMIMNSLVAATKLKSSVLTKSRVTFLSAWFHSGLEANGQWVSRPNGHSAADCLSF